MFLTEHFCRAEHFVRTYVVLVTFHFVCKGSAGELITPEETEVSGHFSGDGGRQALEEALRSLVPHYGFHHRPRSASHRAHEWLVRRKIQNQRIHAHAAHQKKSLTTLVLRN